MRGVCFAPWCPAPACCKITSPVEQRTEAIQGQRRVSRKLAAIQAELRTAPATGKNGLARQP